MLGLLVEGHILYYQGFIEPPISSWYYGMKIVLISNRTCTLFSIKRFNFLLCVSDLLPRWLAWVMLEPVIKNLNKTVLLRIEVEAL